MTTSWLQPGTDGPTPAAPVDLPRAAVRVGLPGVGDDVLSGLPERPPGFGAPAEWVDCAAVRTPDRPFLVAPGLRLTYDEAAGLTDGIAQALIDRDMGPDRPLMLHGPGEPAALLMHIGALKAGVPTAIAAAAPARLAAETGPALVYSLERERADAVRDVARMVGAVEPETIVGVRGVEALAHTPATIEIMEARERTPPDRACALYPAPARAPSPHAVIASRRSVAQATAAHLAAWPFLAARNTVILTAGDPLDPCGAAPAARLAMAVGGTLALHTPRPSAGEIATLMTTIGETGPSLIAEPFDTLDHILDLAEAHPQLADRLASRIDAVWLLDRPADRALAERLERFGRRTRGERIALLDGLALPETAGLALWRRADDPKAAGYVPLPGLNARLDAAAPTEGGGLALSGPAVGPGWFNASDEGRLWDADGFRRIGAPVRFADAGAPEDGFALAAG